MLFGSIEKPETAVPLRVKYFVRLTESEPSLLQGDPCLKSRITSALTHSDGSGISESFLKIDAADADHWKGFDVLLCALM